MKIPLYYKIKLDKTEFLQGIDLNVYSVDNFILKV